MVFGYQVALPAQWFLKRRAFAIGIIVAGSSLGEYIILSLSDVYSADKPDLL